MTSFCFEPNSLDLFLSLLNSHIDIPNEIFVEGYDISAKETIDLEKTFSYKAKKLASALVLKLMKLSRKNPSLSIFSKHLDGFLKSFFNIIQKKSKYIITPQTFLISLKFLMLSLHFDKKTLNQNNFEPLLFEILIPSLFITKTDEELWNQDPQEYIRRQEDSSFIFNRIKSTILWIIDIFCSEDQSFLSKFFQYLEDSFKNNSMNPTIQCLLKEVLIHILGFLKERILDNKILANKTEEVLKTLIFPELMSPIGFLRSRTCWIFQQYEFLNFTDKVFVNNAIENITNCLMDSQIPVQYIACVNLNQLIDNEDVRKKLKPILPKLLELILKIMDNIDNEEIVFALEGVIESFKEDVASFALELLQHLKNAFFKYTFKYKAGEGIEEEEFEKFNSEKRISKNPEESDMAAMKCLETIKTILSTNLPAEIYELSSSFIVDLLNFGLKQEASDYLQQILEILAITVKEIKGNIPDEILFYFPVLIYLCVGIPNFNPGKNLIISIEQIELIRDCSKGWAGIEYIEGMMSCFASFIGKLKEDIFIKKDFFDNSFVSLINLLYKEKEKIEIDNYEKVMLLHLFVLVLECCKDLNEDFMVFLIDISVGDINNSEKSRAIKLKSLEMVFFY